MLIIQCKSKNSSVDIIVNAQKPAEISDRLVLFLLRAGVQFTISAYLNEQHKNNYL